MPSINPEPAQDAGRTTADTPRRALTKSEARAKPHSAEMKAAIVKRAVEGASPAQIAAEFSTRDRPLTRSAIIGIVHRAGVTFTPRKRGVRKSTAKPAQRTRTVLSTKPQSVVMERVTTFIKPPLPTCSWHSCARNVKPGDMFCRGHGRRGVM